MFNSNNPKPVQRKLVVLTFDDAARSHAAVVAPMLKHYGFNATFYVGEFPGFEDKSKYMSWEQIAELHNMGFEIGNHTLSHPDLSKIDEAQQYTEVNTVEQRCRQYGIPVPRTFSYPGCITTDYVMKMLPKKGYTLARIGGGAACNPLKCDPMKVPAICIGGDERRFFYNALKQVQDGEVQVFMFHGVPDEAHPECTTPVERFTEYMRYLKQNGYSAISMEQLASYFPTDVIAPARAAREKYHPYSIHKCAYTAREGLMFVQGKDESVPSARLLNVPNDEPQLRSADETTKYESGKDYLWHDKSRQITLTPNSRIPFITVKDMYKEPGAPNSWVQFRGGNYSLLYAAGTYFHERQVVADYKHRNTWRGYRQASETQRLPRTMNLLKAGKGLRLSLLGDSISTGDNASGKTGIAPYQPFYGELVAAELGDHYKTSVAFTNRSVGGMSSDWGVTQIETVAADKPDLCMIAFGMNDIHGFTAEQFTDNIQKIMTGIKQRCPQVEFLLIAGMYPNSEWINAEREARLPQYEKSLHSMRAPGVAFADVGALWKDVCLLKGFFSLTGNGLNHPNDYSHRLYAQVILASLGIELHD